MQPREVRALGQLAGDALGGAATRIRQMHEGIGERVFESVGPTAAPIKVIHDGIARGVYHAVSRSLGAAARVGANAFSLTRPPDTPSIEQAPAGRVALGALNGAFGDLLDRQGNALAVQMTVRRGGRAVDLTSASLRAAFPDATPRLAVFLHGLCEPEGAWLLGARRHPPYGARLRAEIGYTLNHPGIYEQIRKWLSGRPALPAAPLMLTAGSESDAQAEAQRP